MTRNGLAAALALSLVVAGCAKSREPAPAPREACSCAPSAPVVDVELLAFLSKVRAAHHKADLADEADDKRGAIAALEAVLSGPTPAGAAPEAKEVTADTRARLADLRSAVGDFDAAERDVEEGLKLATEANYFRGHLFEVLGVVLERRAKALQNRGEPDAAERARKAALEAFEKAIAIQDSVIKRALPR
jgi:tetratricopeptide (TPR) repeat protein